MKNEQFIPNREKKCCRDFFKSLIDSRVYEDRSFDYQCLTCGRLGSVRTSADGGLDYRGRLPEEKMSEEIYNKALRGELGKIVQKAAVEGLKKAVLRGKGEYPVIKIVQRKETYDR